MTEVQSESTLVWGCGRKMGSGARDPGSNSVEWKCRMDVIGACKAMELAAETLLAPIDGL